MRNDGAFPENQKRKLLNRISTTDENTSQNSFEKLKAFLVIRKEIEEKLGWLTFYNAENPQYIELQGIQEYLDQKIKEHTTELIQNDNSTVLYFDLNKLLDEFDMHSEYLSVALKYLFYTRISHANYSSRNIIVIHFDAVNKLLIALDLATHSVIQIINGDSMKHIKQKTSVIKIRAKKIVHPIYANAYILENQSFTYIGETDLSLVIKKMNDYTEIDHFSNQGFSDIINFSDNLSYYVFVQDTCSDDDEKKVIDNGDLPWDGYLYRYRLLAYCKRKKENRCSEILCIYDDGVILGCGYYWPPPIVTNNGKDTDEMPPYEEIIQDSLYYNIEDEYDDQYSIDFSVSKYKDYATRVNYRDKMLEVEDLNQSAGTYKEHNTLLSKLNNDLSIELAGLKSSLNVENERLITKIKTIESDLAKQHHAIIRKFEEENENLKNLLHNSEIKNYEVDRLREFVFQFQSDEQMVESESVNILFEKHDIVIIGGNENWRKKVKDKFPKISVIDGSQIFELGILLNYDSILINVYYLSHATYYRVINYVRKHNLNYDFIYATNLEFLNKEIYTKINK